MKRSLLLLLISATLGACTTTAPSLSLSEQAVDAATTFIYYRDFTSQQSSPVIYSFKCHDLTCYMEYSLVDGETATCTYETDHGLKDIFNKNSQGEYSFTGYFHGNLANCLAQDQQGVK